MPVTWEEIEEGIRIEGFRLDNVPARLQAVGELWKPLLLWRRRFRLEQLRWDVSKCITSQHAIAALQLALVLTGIKACSPASDYHRGMNKCIESMMLEHELIIQVLASLQAMAEGLASGSLVGRQDVADFGRFFRDFADSCHHGKEENRLFAKMVEIGFSRESGPIAVMLAEHDAGRQEVRGLLEIGAGAGPLSETERAKTIEYANRFVPLLYGHIQKENNILYPMAQRTIPPAEMNRLDQACQAFDLDACSRLDVAGLKALAAGLLSRFPASPAVLAVYGGCSPCHSAA